MTRANSGSSFASLPPRVPRGLITSPQVNGDPKAILVQLQAGFHEFKSKHEGDVAAMQEAYDKMAVQLAAIGLNGFIGGGAGVVEDPAYSTPFASYFRTGFGEAELKAANQTGERSKIMAAMTSGSDSAGGYLAPVEWDRKIIQSLRTVSPIRRLADVVQTTSRAFTTVWSDGLFGSGWVGETASRPNTTTPTLSAIVFSPGEIFAQPAISQNLLDDADFNVETWLANEVAATFSLQEYIAFVSGDGVNKPVGFLRHITGAPNAELHPGGAIAVISSGAANALTSDGIVDLVYDLGAPYRQGAAFLMSSITASLVAKLKDGQGNYIWREAFQIGQPATLLGYEVAIDENMPAPIAGNTPIAFGNWKAGYLVNDRQGTRVLRDPFSNKPFMSFYTTRRVGGGVRDPRALRVQRIATA